MSGQKSADVIWQKYIDALKRLEGVFENQTHSLNEEDWDNLTSIMGQIENSQLHLKDKWQSVISTGKTGKENVESRSAEKYEEVKLILKKLLDMNEQNEQLLQAEMENLKTNMSNLKKTRRSHKKYITQKQIEEFSPLDISG